MTHKTPTKGTLFDVPVKRIKPKSAFLRKLERQQAQAKAVSAERRKAVREQFIENIRNGKTILTDCKDNVRVLKPLSYFGVTPSND